MTNNNFSNLEITLKDLVEKLKNKDAELFVFYNSLNQVERANISLGIHQRIDLRHKEREKYLVDIENDYLQVQRNIQDIEYNKVFEDDWLKVNIGQINTLNYKAHKSKLAKHYFDLRYIKENSNFESKYTQGKSLITQEYNSEPRYQMNDLLMLIKVEKNNWENTRFTQHLENKKDCLRRKIKWRKALSKRRVERNKELAKSNSKEIKQIIKDRRIKYLAHFTTENALSSILNEGLISRSNKRFNKDYIVVDKQRIDRHYDYLSVSISFPNYKMFYCKRNISGEFNGQNSELNMVNNWVVILLKAEVLWEHTCKFLNDNAASNRVNLYSNNYSSYEDLLDMFSNEDNRHGIPDNYTTNPQAEVLVKGNIPTKFFEKIIFNSDDICNKYSALTDVSCTVDYSFFNPRCDWRVWQNY